MDVVGCGGCRRYFTTGDGKAMLAAIKGACPRCGGRFVLLIDAQSGERRGPRSAMRASELGEDRQVGM